MNKNKPKDYDYYKTRIDKGFYPSVRIFKQSLGRAKLNMKEKQSLIDYAEGFLTESVPGRPKKLEPTEVPSLTPQIVQMVEAAKVEPDHGRPLVAAFGGARATWARADRFTLLIKILSGPSRGEFIQLLTSSVETGMIHPDFNTEVQLLDKLLHKTE